MNTREYTDLTIETVPAWYELSLKGPRTLIIRVHKKGFPDLEGRTWDTIWISEELQKEIGFTPFGNPTDDAWGFEKCLKRVDVGNPDWLCYEAEFPIYKDANGTYLTDARARRSLRCTLYILFMALSLSERETGCAIPQLMTIENIGIREEMYGGTLNAIVTPTLASWLSQQPDHWHLEPVLAAMKDAYHAMWASKPDYFQFGAICRQPKWINLSVPGNACGLDPSDYYDKSPDTGYKLSPHNTDSGLQQLTLLAGLAKLCDLAREEKPQT